MEPKSSSRIDRKKKDTHYKIITVAVDLFNQHGLESVTMDQIAEEADIARGTLYNYFPSKEAVINAYLQRTFQDRRQDSIAKLRQLPDTRSRLTYLFSLLIEGVQRQKQIFEAYMVYRMKKVVSFLPVEEGEQSGLSLLIREMIQLGQQNKELRADLPNTLLEGLFEYALIGAIKPLYLQPESFDQETSIQQSIDLFLYGAQASVNPEEPKAK